MIKFMYCSFLTSSSYVNYTKPCVCFTPDNDDMLRIGVKKITSVIWFTRKLQYICGVMYDESSSNMIYQYSTGSKYDSTILFRSSEGAPFNKAGVLVEFTYGKLG